MPSLVQDVRFALRMFAKQPGFTAVAVLTLALGIGANTAILGLIDALLVRPLPGVTNAGELVWISNVEARHPTPSSLAFTEAMHVRESAAVFSDVTVFRQVDVNMEAGGTAERVAAETVAGNFFAVLGVRPALGRWFLPEEDRTAGTHAVAVIGYDFWQSRFSGDPSILGRRLVLNATEFTIVGVAPRGFVGMVMTDHAPQVWVPVRMAGVIMPADRDLLVDPDYRAFSVIGRLRPGAGVPEARAALDRLAARMAVDQAGRKGVTFQVTPAKGGSHPSDRADVLPIAAVGFGISGVVLLIACANVAGLLLGRSASRGREIGIRVALGASRRRLLQQLLSESLLLALAAGVAGLLLATWTTRALVAAVGVPFTLDVRPNAMVLGGTLLFSLVAAVVFGLAPALNASGPSLVPALGTATVAGQNKRRARLQRVFAIGQVALSLMLLATAGMLLRSVEAASERERQQDEPDRILAASFDLSAQGYPDARQRVFADELVRRVSALPGVESASLATFVPGRATWYAMLPIPGAGSHDGRPPMVQMNWIWPGFFRTMGMPLVLGRDFAPTDTEGALPVLVVNETLVRKYWPGENPVGKQVPFAGKLLTVVGVVRDAVRAADHVDVPGLFMPRMQQKDSRMQFALLLRAQGPAARFAPEVRAIVREMDAALPLFEVATLRQVLDDRQLPKRAGSRVLNAFGGLALVLTAIGIYGLIAWMVGRRTREIGVRMALGATTSSITRMVVGEGLRLAACGTAIGLLLAAAATRLMSGMVAGAVLMDPVMFGAVCALVVGVVALASYLPARRATRVDPSVVLRVD